MAVTNKDCFAVQQIINGLIRKKDVKPSMQAKLKVRKVLRSIDEQRKLVNDELADLHEEYAERDEKGNLIPDQGTVTGVKIVAEKRQAFDDLANELLDVEWPDAPTLSAAMLEREFAPDFETVWLLGDFLVDDLPEDAEDAALEKAEAKRERKRAKRLADVAENGLEPEVVEA